MDGVRLVAMGFGAGFLAGGIWCIFCDVYFKRRAARARS
jgi:hypothetical protein